MDAEVSLDIVTSRGLVVIREWEGDVLELTHSFTPTKARMFADALRQAADQADAEMPAAPF